MLVILWVLLLVVVSDLVSVIRLLYLLNIGRLLVVWLVSFESVGDDVRFVVNCLG